MEPTIKALAVELAGAFYEQERSPAFRKAFPTVNHYLKGWQIVGDRQAKKVPAGWLHHTKLARDMLVRMLGQPDARISPAMKERIYDAICEDRGESLRKGQHIHQRMEREKDGKAERRIKTG